MWKQCWGLGSSPPPKPATGFLKATGAGTGCQARIQTTKWYARSASQSRAGRSAQTSGNNEQHNQNSSTLCGWLWHQALCARDLPPPPSHTHTKWLFSFYRREPLALALPPSSQGLSRGSARSRGVPNGPSSKPPKGRALLSWQKAAPAFLQLILSASHPQVHLAPRGRVRAATPESLSASERPLSFLNLSSPSVL